MEKLGEMYSAPTKTYAAKSRKYNMNQVLCTEIIYELAYLWILCTKMLYIFLPQTLQNLLQDSNIYKDLKIQLITMSGHAGIRMFLPNHI